MLRRLWWRLAGKASSPLTFHDIVSLCQTIQLSSELAMSVRSDKSDEAFSICFMLLCRQIIEILRMADSDVPSTGKIFASCQKLHEDVKTFPGLTAARRTAVKNLVRQRWDMLTSDMHCAGYVLDPEWLSHDVTSDKVSPAYCLPSPSYALSSAPSSSDALASVAGSHDRVHEHPGEGLPRGARNASNGPRAAAAISHQARSLWPGGS